MPRNRCCSTGSGAEADLLAARHQHVAPSVSPAILATLREIGDLKRVRSAGRSGSIASRLFRTAWAGLQDADTDAVALAVTARALAATRLGDLDAAALTVLGVDPSDGLSIQRAGLAAVASEIDLPLAGQLRAALATPLPCTDPPPAFVAALEDQPRAGLTRPGRGRIILQPPENHAEHCLIVAVYGVLLSPAYGAEPGAVFLAALAHHLHNAIMPDAGFTGEMLLGPHLDTAIGSATRAALAELPPDLRRKVDLARAILPDTASPEGRAFHAADVIDRVLEIEQHLTVARLDKTRVLADMELVHAGPVKPFHDDVLRQVGLLCTAVSGMP